MNEQQEQQVQKGDRYRYHFGGVAEILSVTEHDGETWVEFKLGVNIFHETQASFLSRPLDRQRFTKLEQGQIA